MSTNEEMTYKTALKILELDDNYSLNFEKVRKKYRMMALQYHPDKNPSEDAKEHFQEILAAYEFLKRDMGTEEGENFSESSKPSDFNASSYKEILLQFLRGIFAESSPKDTTENAYRIFYNIIHKITQKCAETCETKTLELLGKLNKDVLIKLYDILFKYDDVFRISKDFLQKVREILENRMKNDERIILHPTLEDLFANNLYKLVVGSQTLLIPLWHHELVYEVDGADVYVECVPILSEEYFIDVDNNLYVKMRYNIVDLLDMEQISVEICGNKYMVNVDQLRIVRHQQLLLAGIGIPKIENGGENIYNVEKKANIILDVLMEN